MAKCNLIAYEPIDNFGVNSNYWRSYANFYQIYWGGPTSPFGIWFGNEFTAFRNALSSELDIEESEIRDCYFLKDEKDNYFISPHFDEMQDYMIYAENFIPFEWLVMFEKSERKTLFTHWGFNAIYYHTTINKSLKRINKVYENITKKTSEYESIIKNLGIWDFLENIKTGLLETERWIDSFDPDGYLIMNYGEICNLIHHFTLDKEHSVEEMNNILTNLSLNNFEITASQVKVFVQKWTEISNLASGSQSEDTIQ